MILLKKAMDEVLKKVNLPSLYVKRVKQGGGVTQLCTPCGKPVIFIPDIRITHSKLTKDEREYLINEITEFILDNQKTIKKALSIILTPTTLKEYDDFNVSIQHYYNYYNVKPREKGVKHISVTLISDKSAKKNFQVIFSKKGKCSFTMTELPENELMEGMNRLEEMKEIAKESMKTATKMFEEQNILKELTTCTN